VNLVTAIIFAPILYYLQISLNKNDRTNENIIFTNCILYFSAFLAAQTAQIVIPLILKNQLNSAQGFNGTYGSTVTIGAYGEKCLTTSQKAIIGWNVQRLVSLLGYVFKKTTPIFYGNRVGAC